ncbi:hypothetical protein [Lysobacter gummosus]|uniref:hypothetical protein n=1 Tax=Lysobacter gummosus TaxID=262324 RepID=UPI00363631AC
MDRGSRTGPPATRSRPCPRRRGSRRSGKGCGPTRFFRFGTIEDCLGRRHLGRRTVFPSPSLHLECAA